MSNKEVIQIMADTLSGFDMKNTIRWYHENCYALSCKIPIGATASPTFPIYNFALTGMTPWEIQSHILAFPYGAQTRIKQHLRKIVGQESAWFHRNSTSEKPIPTNDINEAIFTMAIIPSYNNNNEWIKTNQPQSEIWLYQLELPSGFHFRVGKIIISQGLIHELGHVLSDRLLYLDNYQLLYRGKNISGQQLILDFANMAEKHPPISIYSSLYRKSDNTFDSTNGNKLLRDIGEEIAETVAAHILGFAYCGDHGRSMNPFVDRPEIKKWVKMFLNAKAIE